ncbi:MAG: hypothetical protein K9N51_04130 [Candidatus Pacebacteria bacterium]|nr:hypothetical protein [Candidatus Paceibacterota bacterium]
MQTILFFDDQRLSQRDNMKRRIGNPVRLEESVFRDPEYETQWAYPSVFFDADSGTWRMTYLGFPPPGSSHKRVALLAESNDRMHWRRRDTVADIDLPDRQAMNQVLPLKEFGEWPACYVDPYAPAEERIKGLVVFHTSKNFLESRLWVSPDGLHWTRKEGVEWQRRGPDPGVHVFWNDVRRSYCITTRADWSDRRISIFETKDWEYFTEPELVMQADALDEPLTEPYGMPVIPYYGYYIGLLWLFHCVPYIPGSSPHKFMDGHVDCQLAYSLNGWHWQRTLRDPFIPNGAPGDPDAGAVYPSSCVIAEDGDIDLYASACTCQHGRIPQGSGSIAAYRLRRDGWVYLESRAGVGLVGTRSVFWEGGELEINVACPDGEARVQITQPDGTPIEGFVFADCIPCSEDAYKWMPQWREDRCMNELKNCCLRIEIQLNNGRLYAIRGDFLPLVAGQVWRYEEDGVRPQPRPGF